MDGLPSPPLLSSRTKHHPQGYKVHKLGDPSDMDPSLGPWRWRRWSRPRVLMTPAEHPPRSGDSSTSVFTTESSHHRRGRRDQQTGNGCTRRSAIPLATGSHDDSSSSHSIASSSSSSCSCFQCQVLGSVRCSACWTGPWSGPCSCDGGHVQSVSPSSPPSSSSLYKLFTSPVYLRTLIGHHSSCFIVIISLLLALSSAIVVEGESLVETL